ncbi:aldehyde oxidase/xanthine dehydrogenase a/b hammerhead [Lucifera butyrica]|uniref:Aldehyde oxidase/xanthine dehydrogenase a/b hammerhead n=1 Tax=Lucifera butyrica TaxID=1351585 RepID=A0A498R6T4_9FIRM|nr:xanthine dehydrogenase family protein molybdopterin-binding subunit [Lucifera butyrica]VBB06620.1 aldehyde oxidase/xanthine dehydrogenase a/b hammerhead [Lucifera butyrica]
METVGRSVPRKEAWDKVTGAAKYNDDYLFPGMLYTSMVNSPHAHAGIVSIDISGALAVPGVEAVVTGKDFPRLCGSILEDRPPLARDKVRYFGEPVALVIANREAAAMQAAGLIKVIYELLPAVNSTAEALKEEAPLIHPDLGQYKRAVPDVYPEPGSNICGRVNIAKGDLLKGWETSEVIIEADIRLPQSDHVAMEPRNAKAEILPSGTILIYTSTQAPFEIRDKISHYANVDESRVVVKTPLVGGGFGGKATLQLELLAYMASKAVNGKLVRVANTREQDFAASPCHAGLEAKIKLGATKDGEFKAADIIYHVDTGAYAGLGPRLAKAMAADCTGPYNFEHVRCEAVCIYTNHCYATAFRGFGHVAYNFCMERAIDKLAHTLGMDPLELRLRNAILPGDTSPTRVQITQSNVGDLQQCLRKLRKLVNWDEGVRRKTGDGKVVAKGIACFWKTSDSPPDASAGAIVTMNPDGSLNLNCGAVEIGSGMKTTLAQILAEKLKMDIDRIHVVREVDTQVSPKHWKTVASMTTFLAGNAVLAAADDLIAKLKKAAAAALHCSPRELAVGNELVYFPNNPDLCISFKEIVHGCRQADGSSTGGPVIGSGGFVMPGITLLDPYTGAGKPGPYWTVGAQAVEVELDTRDYTYRLRKAATVLDAGKVINPELAEGQVRGGMCMGLGLGTREEFRYSAAGKLAEIRLRNYKVMHYGETPHYLVQFVETPQREAPYGARGLGEHGIIGIPAALANALSAAAQAELNFLPLVPESIWRVSTEGFDDTL